MTARAWNTTRRAVLGGLAALPVTAVFAGRQVSAAALINRPIPGTGETLPVIGMGSWITFNVGADERLRAARSQVLQAFFWRISRNLGLGG